MALFFNDNFDTGAIADEWTEGTGAISSAQTYASSAYSYKLAVDADYETQAITRDDGLDGGGDNSEDEFYALWYLYVDSNYDFPATESHYVELFRIAGYENSANFRGTVRYYHTDERISFVWYSNAPATGSEHDWSLNSSGVFTLSTGVWHKMELHCALNSSGAADGEVDLTIDNVAIISSANRDFRDTTVATAFDAISIRNYYGSGEVPAVESIIYVDSFEIHGSEPAGDTTEPVLSNIQAGSITLSGATITWTTDEPATGQVEYGETVAYGSTTTLDTGYKTSHSHILTGLESETTYHYRIISADIATNEATSGDYTFDTLAPEIPSAETPEISGVTRQFIFAIDPEEGLCNTYSWEVIPDGNSDRYGITCAYVPPMKGTGINLMQEEMFMGTINAGLLIRTFMPNLAQDDGENIKAMAILGNCDPEASGSEDSGDKRFVKVSFPFVNPLALGLEITFAKDTIDPHINATTWNTLDWVSGSDVAGVPSGLAKWLNFKIVDEIAQSLKPVFSSFTVSYYPMFEEITR